MFDREETRRHWNEAVAGELEWAKRPSVNRELRWRELLRRLDGMTSVLDVGAGPGTFSIPLAKRGLSVTHFDLSDGMIDAARREAAAAGVTGGAIRFVQGHAGDMSMFDDRSFDLVINMDGPISASGDEAERVVRETCRVARRRIVLTAAHGAWMMAEAERGEDVKRFRAFLPDELRRVVEDAGFRVLRCGGIGSLESLCGRDYVSRVMGDPPAAARFVDACDRFDHHVLRDGPGSPNDTGLIISALRRD
jgi:SAM-dependent methyltransferase